LFEEAPVWFHGAEEFCLLAALDIGAPAVRDHPAGEELVVAGVELVFSEPKVVGEAVEELGVLEDDGAVSSGAAGKTGEATVDVSGAGDFDVANGETEGGEDLPDGHAVADGLDALAGADAADLLVLEAGEDGWEQGRGPDGVVVGEEDDVCGCVLDAVAHLETLVGKGDGEDTDALWVDSVCEGLELLEHFFLCDDDDLLWLADEPAAGGLLELLSGIYGGNDDGNVLRGDIGWVFG
jgi:hypothetical protein